MVAQVEHDEWLQERSTGIGASESAAVLGLSPWKSPYSLWSEKTGLVPRSQEETESQRWGSLLEPAIAEEYAIQTGRKLIDHGRHALKRSTACPILIATLDREIEPIDERGPGVLEIKTTSAYKDADWSDGAPLMYQVQIQHQLAVTGFRWGSAAVLIGGQKFRWIDVERNDAFIEVLTRKCVEFWKLVETRTPPPIDGSDATADALKKLYPNDTGESVALPGDAIHWDTDVAEASAAIKAAEARKQEAMNKITAAIGSATFGILPSGGRWSLKTTTRKGYTVEEKTYRTPRRLSK